MADDSDVDMSDVDQGVQDDFDMTLIYEDWERANRLLKEQPALLKKYMVPFKQFKAIFSHAYTIINIIRNMFRNIPTYAEYIIGQYSEYFETRGTDLGAPPSEVPAELIDLIRQLLTPDDQEDEGSQGEVKEHESATPPDLADFFADVDNDDMMGGYTAYPGFTGLTGK